VRRITFDFIAQLEKKMESDGISQAELAVALGVSESAVSRVLNDPPNLTLRTIVKYALAVGTKAALVAYDDADYNNTLGPVNSEVFSVCWERAGKPHDMWGVADNFQVITIRTLSVTWMPTEQLAFPSFLRDTDPWGYPISVSWYYTGFQYVHAECQVPVSLLIEKRGSNVVNG
jgi:transcriptional regulator with XRE-family HTH domain